MPRWLLALTVVVATFLAAEAVISWREARSWTSEPDYALFKKICTDCHDENHIRRRAKSPAGWNRTIDWMMAEQRRALAGEGYPFTITDDEIRRVKDLVIRRRSADGETLFGYRCGTCHSRSVVEPYLALAPDALRALIAQHAFQNNFAVETWEGREIAEALVARRPSASGGNSGAEVQVRYQRMCGACHTPAFLYHEMCEDARDAAGWRAVVFRMHEKAPTMLTERYVDELADHARSICESRRIVP